MKRLTDGEKATIKWLISFVEKHDGCITNAFEYGKEEMLDNSCEWLEENISDYVITGKSVETYEGIDIDRLINDIKKAMEAEK